MKKELLIGLLCYLLCYILGIIGSKVIWYNEYF